MALFTLLQTSAAVAADTTKNFTNSLEETVEKLADMPTGDMLSYIIEHAISIGLKILAAIVIYSVGAWLIQRAKKIIKKILVKRNVEPSLSTFILSFISISFTILLLVITVQTLGVDTSSFVALLAGSGLAIGMALSGTLQNFAGGVMILLFKPFKVGDYIETQGYSGTVNSIQITSTVIKTTDNKTIVLPNGALSNGAVNNFSTSLTRRCDWEIGISYGDDVDKAKKIILDILNANPAVLKEPAEPFAALKTLGDSAVVIVVRAWVKNEDYWNVYFSFNEIIYKELPKNNIHFPFPQMDVHVIKNEA